MKGPLPPGANRAPPPGGKRPLPTGRPIGKRPPGKTQPQPEPAEATGPPPSNPDTPTAIWSAPGRDEPTKRWRPGQAPDAPATTRWRAQTTKQRRTPSESGAISDGGLLSGNEQERLWRAREALKLCGKCFRNLRLYPEGHRYREAALAEFHEQLQAALTVTGTLRLTVTEAELLLDGQRAYDEASLKENMARRLFLDGVRELTIGERITPEESASLVLVLHVALGKQELDITNLLDDAALDHVDFEATSALADAWEPPDYLSGKALDIIEDMNVDVDLLVADLTRNLQGERLEFELSDGARETKEADRAKDVEVGAEAAGDLYRLPPDALEALRAEVARWGPQELLVTVVEAALEVREDLSDEQARWILGEALVNALRSKDLQLLLHLLQRFEDVAAKSSDGAFFEDLLGLMSEDATQERLVGLALSGGYLGGSEVLIGLLDRLGERGRYLAIRLILESEEEALNDKLLEFLGPHAAANPEVVRPLLDPEVPASKAYSALFLLSKKARQADLTELLELGRRHPEAKVHEYAQHLWKTLTEAGQWDKYVQGLFNPSRVVRLQSLQKLIDARRPDAVPALLRTVQEDAFLQRDHDERHAIFLALTLLDREQAIQILDDQTRRKTWLRNRQAAGDTRELARQVLNDLLAEDS